MNRIGAGSHRAEKPFGHLFSADFSAQIGGDFRNERELSRDFPCGEELRALPAEGASIAYASNDGANFLPSRRIFDCADQCVMDARTLLQDLLDFRRTHFFSRNIDYIAFAPNNPEPAAVTYKQVIGTKRSARDARSCPNCARADSDPKRGGATGGLDLNAI